MTTLFPPAIGWNTWDVQFHTGWVHLPDGFRVRLVVVAGGVIHDDITWRTGMTALGPHTIDGTYSDSSWERAGLTIRARAASSDGCLAIVVATTAVDPQARCGIIVDRSPASPDREPVWEVSVTGAATQRAVIDGTAVLIVDENHFGIQVAQPDAQVLGSADLSSLVDAAERVACASEIYTSGWLGDAGQAMSRAVTWNTVYVPELGRVLTPTSRDFVSAAREGFYGTWAVHAWDTFFTALVAAPMDQNFAGTIVDQILRFATPSGMLPNRVSDDRGATLDRSQPPVGAVTILESYRASGLSDETRGQDALKSVLPALVRWHDWWLAARVGPIGVLTWGSDPVDGDPESCTTDRARRESGLDDSPMYDDVTIHEPQHTIDLADVGLNALHIADARALSEIAEIVGDRSLADRYTTEADEAVERFDDVFWSDAHGLYLNRFEDGRFSPSISPTMFYPLLAGIPDRDRARALAERLLAPDVLGGEPPLPSVARDDPGFDSNYWRGRIWAPIVYLSVTGLRRYGFDDLASPVVDSLLGLFLHEWEQRSSVRENYPSIPGEDVTALHKRSDALMAWGGLLGLLGIGEVVRPDAGGWRFSHPSRHASVGGIEIAEGTLSVIADDRLRLVLNDRELFSTPAGSTITGFSMTASGITATIALCEDTGAALEVQMDAGGIAPRVYADGRQIAALPDSAGIRFALPAGHSTFVQIDFEKGM